MQAFKSVPLDGMSMNEKVDARRSDALSKKKKRAADLIRLPGC